MFYIPNRNRIRQLIKKQFSFINRAVSPLSFGKDIEINRYSEIKKTKTKDYLLCLWNTLANRYQKCFISLQKMDTPRVRASAVFRFLPSPFTSMPYFLIDRWLQVKAKTVFSFTPCDLPFLTRRGREISNKNAEKEWTLNKNVPTFVPKSTTIQATPAQRWRQRWTQTFTFVLHRINLIYCTLYK